MSDDNIREIYKTLQNSQDKFVYFLLAATITSIGFIVTQTQSLLLVIDHIPLGISLICFGFSFWCGCRNRLYVNSTLYSNADYLKIKTGKLPHPGYGNHPDYIEAASSVIKDAMEKNSIMINRYGRMQTNLFMSGAFFFIIWNIIEMYIRSN